MATGSRGPLRSRPWLLAGHGPPSRRGDVRADFQSGLIGAAGGGLGGLAHGLGAMWRVPSLVVE